MAAAAATPACEALARRHDSDRYLAGLFAPADKRQHLFALYAFNHEIGHIAEAVREPMLGEIRRQWWREAVEGAAAGAPRRHDVVEALVPLLNETLVTAGDLIALIDARAADMPEERVVNLAAMEAYAGATSGALMRLAARILGADIDETAHAAGIAYGLTGLLRAAPFHAKRRKCYLPLDLLRAQKVAPHQLYSGQGAEALPPVYAAIAACARAHLQMARGAKPGHALPALLPAALCEAYLRPMLRQGFNPFRDIAELPVWRKQIALLLAATRGRL